MPIKLNNAQSHENEGHGFSFAQGADAELNSPVAIKNKKDGFHFEGNADSVKQAIEELKLALQHVPSASDQSTILPVLDQLSTAVDQPAPDKTFLQQSLTSLRDFSAKASGSAVGTAAIKLLEIANDYWHLIG